MDYNDPLGSTVEEHACLLTKEKITSREALSIKMAKYFGFIAKVKKFGLQKNNTIKEKTQEKHMSVCANKNIKNYKQKNYHTKEIILANTIHPEIYTLSVSPPLAKKYGEANFNLMNIKKD